MEWIFAVETAEEFDGLVASRPAILSTETEDEFAAMGALEGFETTAEALVELVREARSSPREAWDRFHDAMKRAEQLGAELETECDEIQAAIEANEHDEVIRRVDRVLPRARAAGLGVLVGVLRSQRAAAYFERRDGDRAENIDKALEDYDAARRLVVSDEQHVEVLMHAGIAYLERVRGDRAENIEQAVSVLREALSALDSSSPPELHAIVKTNLATALLRRERGNRSQSLVEARSLCRGALQYRSPHRNADDWAYSQINLGNSLELLAELEAADINDAVRAYDSVLAEDVTIGQEWLRGAAHYAIGRLQRRRAHPSAEKLVAAAEQDAELELDRQLLESARQHLETAYGSVEKAPDFLLPGRVAMELSAVLGDLGDEGDRALAITREALSILRPTAAPADCIRAGFRLGGMYADRQQWNASADAYRDALQAAELTFHARLETESREADIRAMGQLFRWAAFSIAAAGDPLEAALVLESGRTRELRRRLGLERAEADRIEELPADLAERYRRAVKELAGAPIGGPAGRELQETLELIRSIDGFETFGGAAHISELSAAVEPGWPLIYVNPTPAGTLLLLVRGDVDKAHVHSIFLDTPESLSVFLRLMAGDAAADPSLMETAEPSSYFALVAGVGDRPPQQDLDQAVPWIGEAIARPISDVAREVGAHGLTIVPCGPIAVAPIHASPWRSDQAGLCRLVDEFEIRYAQSALIAATGIRRAAGRAATPAALVALANPTRDLPAAEPEVEEIATHFSAEQTVVATGVDATAAFLRGNANRATYLHLAGHARGGLLGTEAPAALLLADGWLAATAVTEVAEVQARLVVISACQSAVTNIAALADEGISIGSVLMAAGAACTIASLWPVHDLATALLMTRLYEEMFNERHRPPEALRRAQLWLRHLDFREEQAFLDRHPALRAEFNKRAESGDLPGRRRSRRGSVTPPYAHEYFWAAFVAVGA